MTTATYRFGNNLEAAMRLASVQTSALAVKLGWMPRRLRRLLSGETRPSLDDVEALAVELGCDPGVLAFGKITDSACASD